MALELTITNEQKVKITVNPVTAAGKPVGLDGPVVASIQAGEGSIVPVDNLNFYIVSGDNPGDISVLVSGDADLGEGVETISDIVLVHVAGAKASSLGLIASPAEIK